MIMPPGLRKLALTVHVTTSVGWLGAAAAFLGLAVVGLTGRDAPTVRGAYLVMEAAAWLVLVPLAFASLLTGLIMSLATTWGLFRHYWVLYKLVINVFATIILLTYMETFRFMADVAADPNADLGVVRNASPALHAALALLVLLVAAVLAVYKPQGVTRYGWRKQLEQRKASRPIPPRRPVTTRTRGEAHLADLPPYPDPESDTGDETSRRSTISSRRRLYLLIGIIGLVLLVVVLHLIGGGLRFD